jgi:hypothetical protein
MEGRISSASVGFGLSSAFSRAGNARFFLLCFCLTDDLGGFLYGLRFRLDQLRQGFEKRVKFGVCHTFHDLPFLPALDL